MDEPQVHACPCHSQPDAWTWCLTSSQTPGAHHPRHRHDHLSPTQLMTKGGSVRRKMYSLCVLPAHLCLSFPSHKMRMTTLISRARAQSMWEKRNPRVLARKRQVCFCHDGVPLSGVGVASNLAQDLRKPEHPMTTVWSKHAKYTFLGRACTFHGNIKGSHDPRKKG